MSFHKQHPKENPQVARYRSPPVPLLQNFRDSIDRRLGDWLFARIFHGKSCRAPVPVAMIRKGKNVYKVQPFTLPPASTNGFSRIGPVRLTPPK
jgi:hypothetical protein